MSTLGLRCLYLRHNVGLRHCSLVSKTRKFDLRSSIPPETIPYEEPVHPQSFLANLPIPNLFNLGIFRVMTMRTDFRSEKIASWWRRKRYTSVIGFHRQEIKSYRKSFGPDLAVGKLILDLQGSVRFVGKPWMKEDTLPSFREDGWVLEGIDVSGLEMYYESFECLRHVHHVKVLNTSHSAYFDDWCLDFICGEFPKLETLDVTGCQKLTWRSLYALCRLKNLRNLKIGGIPALENPAAKVVCIDLVELNPELVIDGFNYLEV